MIAEIAFAGNIRRGRTRKTRKRTRRTRIVGTKEQRRGGAGGGGALKPRLRLRN